MSHAVPKQQTFDFVARHLLTQNTPASIRGSCQYRLPDGRTCAAGCLIPQDQYSVHFEGNSIFDNGHLSLAGLAIQNLGHDIELVRSLQICHDSYVARDWPVVLRKIAREHSLLPAVVDELRPNT